MGPGENNIKRRREERRKKKEKQRQTNPAADHGKVCTLEPHFNSVALLDLDQTFGSQLDFSAAQIDMPVIMLRDGLLFRPEHCELCVAHTLLSLCISFLRF